LICVLARLYCRRLFEAVRFGLRQEYVAHDEVLPILRGKVHWPSQARRQAAQRLECRCLFDERSADTPLNRTLKAALLAAERMLEGATATSAATELRHLFLDVPDACPPREVVARLRTDRMSRRLAPLLALARLLRTSSCGRGGAPASSPTRSGSASIRGRPISASRARTSTRCSTTPTATPPGAPS
jgi:5-methylcytosine-specific restriction enzyme subunit McrC